VLTEPQRRNLERYTLHNLAVANQTIKHDGTTISPWTT
jgi:hypothetical protein